MTFHEAGLAILERAGRPLSAQEITSQAVSDGLLSHVGQIPEQTMLQRLVALAHRTRNRRVAVVAPGQFALTDWGLAEDQQALEQLGAPETPDEGPPRRGKERHPAILAPRGGGRDRDGKRRRKRLPPLAEVAFEILSDAKGALPPEEILERARERELVGEELSLESLTRALADENRRRSEAGRRPAFAFSDAGAVEIVEGPAEPQVDPRRQPSPRPVAQGLDSKRNAARQIRRRLAELDPASLERVVVGLLEKGGYRDCRTVKRGSGREGALLVASRRLGLLDVRFAIRLCPQGDVRREDVQELRRDLVAQAAHAGIAIGAGDATRDARTEATAVGQPLVTLLCADALAEELVMRQVGCFLVEQCVVDDGFWRTLRQRTPSESAPAPRDSSERGRPRRDGSPRERPPAAEPASPAATLEGSAPEAPVTAPAAAPEEGELAVEPSAVADAPAQASAEAPPSNGAGEAVGGEREP
ncbi:MAG: HTH domain-containing protein [Deltaproteobacteria bacterium]